MGQVSAKLRSVQDGYSYWCQGCEEMHAVKVPGWGFDGNLEHPTFTPSVLIRSGHYLTGPDKPCWCTYYAQHPDKTPVFKCSVCHTFITAGMVQFLGDCTHPLAGQTLPLPDLPPGLRDTE